MSWPAAEGRHYLPRPARWWYWGYRGTGPQTPALRSRSSSRSRSLRQGNEMGQYGTGSGATTNGRGASGHGTAAAYANDQRTSRDGYTSTWSPGPGASRGGAPVVSFVNVSKHYGNLHAVDGLNLDLHQGETVALLGPNGAGKSTSLDMLLALRKPTSGQITMFGSDPYHAVKSGRVGAMLQSGGLMPEVTVRELVTLVTTLHPKPEPIDLTLKRAGIDKFADQRVDRLSGGQTQRVRFSLAICGKSELIVLDEPTAAMDVETRRLFWASMKEEVAEGRTLLFATHYLEEADQAAARILAINRGRLLADGTPADIKKRAGARRLSFKLDRVDEHFLLGLPGLVNLEVRHDLVQIQTSDSDATLYAV